VEGAAVLDLFAGSGALGIEALSRGAERATFVETARGPLGMLDVNLRALGVGREEAIVLRGEAIRETERLGRAGERFDLVFADPPYLTGLAGRTLEAAARARILSPAGLFVLEHHRREALPETPGLRALAPRRYGDTVLSFYGNREGGSP
jgi:16S rRNA (guanine(966)-N(2))-methyltransferase RsmD